MEYNWKPIKEQHAASFGKLVSKYRSQQQIVEKY